MADIRSISMCTGKDVMGLSLVRTISGRALLIVIWHVSALNSLSLPMTFGQPVHSDAFQKALFTREMAGT